MIMTCEGCGKDFRNLLDSHAICTECVKARHRAVINRGRCTCRKKDKRPREVSAGRRRWVACDRCLGQIEALPDLPIRLFGRDPI